MSEKLTINLRGLQNVKKSSENITIIPDDYVEIIPKYIKIYQGCWIKYTSKDSGLSFPGGYLIEVTDEGIAILRNIRRDVFERKIVDNIFYCKHDTPHHKAVKSLIEEKDRFSLKVEAFNVEKQKFIQKRINSFVK